MVYGPEEAADNCGPCKNVQLELTKSTSQIKQVQKEKNVY